MLPICWKVVLRLVPLIEIVSFVHSVTQIPDRDMVVRHNVSSSRFDTTVAQYQMLNERVKGSVRLVFLGEILFVTNKEWLQFC